jgi:prolyl-tRNA editing enzyme YbaK/EbsC (Cys-tRNA(Pro) deacylase)
MSESLRSPEELRAFAAEHGIVAELHVADRPLPTVEEAARAMGVPPEAMTKNIVFLVAGKPVLVIATGTARVDDRALARHFAVSRSKVKIATPDEALAASGFVVGCMPSFGHREPLPTCIDPAVLVLPRVYGGTGDEAVLVSLAPDDLLAITGGAMLPLGR